ncbi:hypothetical protein BC834DRAFT_99101 [Gloeopeniophorella convolvens]|nr:hypothetical protein BC834DRAFT_99101 [Gloeopeniophorella convolvens]
MSHSPSPAPAGPTEGNSTRHARNALEKQRQQLERLLKDPAKPAPIPAAPKEKAIRPPRDMMKNVQGSSAGAGSGEFHVYKASRRREYERIKAISDDAQKTAETREFEERKRRREEEADAKTAKNRARRQKKKERALKGAKPAEGGSQTAGTNAGDAPLLKKRRVVNGKAVAFRRPGEESDEDGDEGGKENEEEAGPQPASVVDEQETGSPLNVPIAEIPSITIHEDD